MTGARLKILALLTFLLPVLPAAAQGRPGVDRPIRVAMFKGIGPGMNWHSSIHTSHTVMASLLANPGSSGLGDSLTVPPAGFTFYSVKTKLNSTGSECAGNGCGPDAEEIARFVAYVRDSADVMVLANSTFFGGMVTDDAQRQILANFWNTKGYVGIHAIADSKGAWTPLDSVHGTQFNNHPNEQSARIRIDTVHRNEAAWRNLNRGVFSNGADTSFVEEWFFYTNSGAQIRARPSLKPTLNLDETGMTNIGGSLAMGDHPMSWYRELPAGGRTFYTGLGHRANVWQENRGFRRQIYNAILWASKYASPTSLRPGPVSSSARGAFLATAARRTLKIRVIPEGAHVVELVGVDGRRLAARKGGTGQAHAFEGLRPGTYAVTVTTAEGRARGLVPVP